MSRKPDWPLSRAGQSAPTPRPIKRTGRLRGAHPDFPLSDMPAPPDAPIQGGQLPPLPDGARPDWRGTTSRFVRLGKKAAE